MGCDLHHKKVTLPCREGAVEVGGCCSSLVTKTTLTQQDGLGCVAVTNSP